MCGRYSQTHSLADLAKKFNIKLPAAGAGPRYNIAPNSEAQVVLPGGELKNLKWGLMPHWLKDAKEGFINARAEGIASRPSFREAFYKYRCLVPADGFYEWKDNGPGLKTPYRFETKDGGLFSFAGLYEPRTSTFAIVTCSGNMLMRSVHSRMPVILTPGGEALWNDAKRSDSETLLELLTPYESGLMKAFRVSPLVNDPANESPDCARPAA